MQLKKTILCIDDNEDTRELIEIIFKDAGFEVTACDTPEEGIRRARTNEYAAIITDFYLDGMDGTDLCRAIRTFDAATPIVFFTGEARSGKKQLAIEAGAQAYIIKPTDFELLKNTVLEFINTNESL